MDASPWALPKAGMERAFGPPNSGADGHVWDGVGLWPSAILLRSRVANCGGELSEFLVFQSKMRTDAFGTVDRSLVAQGRDGIQSRRLDCREQSCHDPDCRAEEEGDDHHIGLKHWRVLSG